tara:strand:+ start:684 stop:848 length:165 start_codon:yes stop_codon:yes gene_type:complete
MYTASPEQAMCFFRTLTLNFPLASNFSHTKVYIKAIFIGYWGQTRILFGEQPNF